MKNIYTDKLKKVLTTLNNAKIKAENEIKNAKSSYLASVADTKIKEINSRQTILTEQARESVHLLFNDLRQRLSYADFPSSEDLSTDRLFFDGTADIDLSIEQVKTFIERYRNNFTMLKLIKKWIIKNHPSENGGFDDWTMLANTVPEPKKQLEEYRKIFKSCLSSIESIANHSVSDVIINAFCGNENAKFWDIIGSGEHLKSHSTTDYRSTKLPIGAGHLFDDISL